MSEEKPVESLPTRRRRGRSMLGPVILIAAGVLLLLFNLGLLPELNWWAALRLWPLLLIFIGLNIIVRQASRPLGTVLSLLVALVTVSVFGAVLFLGADFPGLSRLDETSLERRQVVVAADDIAAARLFLDGSSRPMRLTRLEDSDNLLEGMIPGGDRRLDTAIEDGTATIRLDADTPADIGFGFLLDPADWGDVNDQRMDVAFTGRVPLDLRLDVASGPAEMDLAELTLSHVEVDGGSGSLAMTLPGGAYDLEMDVSSGSVSMELLEAGEITMNLEGGSGPLTVALPEDSAVRLELRDRGSGPVNVAYSGLRQLEESEAGAGVWETSDYEQAANQITLILVGRSGPIDVVER